MTYLAQRLGELGLKRRARPKVAERDVLSSVLEYVQRHRTVAWAVRMNTGATKVDGRCVRFGFKGLSDIIGQLKDGRFFAIECKSSTGTLTQAQRDFIDLVRNSNGIAGVARRIEDAERLLT